jgi:succinoglycan biosynthesis protein ExoA
MSDDVLISIVLPIRNEAAAIDECLKSLVEQTLDRDSFEIIVIDGMSTDETPNLVAGWQARDERIRLVANPRRITPISLNLGIRAARGSIIARMDGHSRADPGYLAIGLDALRETGAWSVGGQMRRVGGDDVTRAIAAVTMSPFGVGDAAHNYSERPMWAETVFLGMWPRWVFERVGLFDEELVRNQDDEFSYRIRKAGGRIWFDPRIVTNYSPRGTLSGLFSQYRQYAMWKVRVLQMHPGALRWRHWVPMLLVAFVFGSAVIGIWWPFAWLGTVAGLGTYFAAVTVASRRLRRSGVSMRSLVATFLTLHSAYGLGFWQGLVRFAPRWFVRRSGDPARLENASRR